MYGLFPFKNTTTSSCELPALLLLLLLLLLEDALNGPNIPSCSHRLSRNGDSDLRGLLLHKVHAHLILDVSSSHWGELDPPLEHPRIVQGPIGSYPMGPWNIRGLSKDH